MIFADMKLLTCIFVIFLFMHPVSSKAGIFGPSDRKDCEINYAAKAVSNRAVAILNTACSNIFEQPAMLEYMQSIFGYKYLKVATNPANGQKAIFNSSSFKWEILSSEVATNLDQGYELYKTKMHKIGKCVLSLRELYTVQNDLAASLVYNNSPCFTM